MRRDNRVTGESPVKKTTKRSMEEAENEMQIGTEREKVLERELEREKKERMALEKDFKECLLMSNSDMLQVACKMRYKDNPFAVLTEQMAAIRAENREDSEISPSGLVLSNDRNYEVDGHQGDYFPFLALADVPISLVFSFLSTKDRLRARVTKRLDEIELQSKYYVEELRIIQGAICEDLRRDPCTNNFIDGRLFSSDCTSRLAKNLTIGNLIIHVNVPFSDFHRQVNDLIKDCDVEGFSLEITDLDQENEIVVDSFFFDLSRACTYIYLGTCVNITPEAIHQVYKMMIEGSTPLNIMQFTIGEAQCISFLGLIGVTYRDGKFFSNRNVEAIEFALEDEKEDGEYGPAWINLFDGNLQIGLCQEYCEEGSYISEEGKFRLELHDSEESLAQVKNSEGAVKIDITPE